MFTFKCQFLYFYKCIFLLMLIMKYKTVCSFSKLSIPVQLLISGEVILSEIHIKRFEDQQMCTMRSVI